MNKKLLMCLATFLLCVSAAVAQTKISGTVVSAGDNEPVIGATITVVGTKTAAVTDFDGKFSLTTDVPNPQVTISYIGMVAQTLKATANMHVELKANAQVLNEVVVTGLTRTDRRLFTGATDKVDAEKARLSGVADISRSLEGQAAGVSVQNVSGTFGTAPKIRVRGATSIYGSSKPLWVVDGVIMEDAANVGADDLASGNPETLISSAIAGLNADDIESFQILKDGSATSIYGARAMAGVIVVTTKKGKQGQAHISYTGEFTTRLVPSYNNFDILDSKEQMGIYREMADKGWLNLSEILNGSEYGVYGKMYELINRYDARTGRFALENTTEAKNRYLRQAEFRNTDWFNELFTPSIMQNHSISLSGGTQSSNYYASFSAMLDPGWYKQSNVNRYTLSLNLTQHLSDKLSLNFIGSAAYRKQRAPGTLGQDVDVVGGEVKRDFDINPYSYASNTSRVLDPNEYYVANFAPFNIFNELNNNYIDLNVLDAKFQLELKYKPIKGLELSALGAFKYMASTQEHNVKDNSNQAMAYRAMSNGIIREANKYLYNDPSNPYKMPFSVLPYGGLYHKGDNRMSDYDLRATANYNHTFADTHIMNLFAGTEVKSIERQRNSFEGSGLRYDAGQVPFYIYEYFKRAVEGGNTYYMITPTNSRSVAFYGNTTYSYKGRYVFNGTLRYEGSNQMGRDTNARWMPTWNVSGAWNVHEEGWFGKLSPLSRLTLRASYSLTGTPPDASYSNSTAIIKASNPFRLFAEDQEPQLEIYELANANLTYEKKNELNLGFDASLWNNRLGITFDFYTRRNFDEIGPMVTAGTGGQIIRAANVAEMNSNGVELSLSSVNLKNKHFSWTTNFIYAYANTEITKLFNQGNVVSGSGFAKRGYPARSLFSIPFVGLNDEGMPLVLNEKGMITTDDINFQERTLTDFLKYEGPTDPLHTGSIGNMFTYRGFRLNVFVTYAFGNVVRLDPKFRARYNDLVSMTNAFKNRWTKSGEEDRTNVPGIISKAQYMANTNLRLGYNAYNYTDVRIAKGDFIRLKEVSLGYDLPAQWFQKAMVKNVSLKLQATNLFLLYADKRLNGQDPEFYNVGGVASPMPKQFTLTIKLGL